MTKGFLASALAGACMLGTAPVVLAAVAGEYGNYCGMGLVKGDKKITDCSISQKIEDKTYCFGSNAAKKEFMEDPAGNISKAQATFSGE